MHTIRHTVKDRKVCRPIKDHQYFSPGNTRKERRAVNQNLREVYDSKNKV